MLLCLRSVSLGDSEGSSAAPWYQRWLEMNVSSQLVSQVNNYSRAKSAAWMEAGWEQRPLAEAAVSVQAKVRSTQ